MKKTKKSKRSKNKKTISELLPEKMRKEVDALVYARDIAKEKIIKWEFVQNLTDAAQSKLDEEHESWMAASDVETFERCRHEMCALFPPLSSPDWSLALRIRKHALREHIASRGCCPYTPALLNLLCNSDSTDGEVLAIKLSGMPPEVVVDWYNRCTVLEGWNAGKAATVGGPPQTKSQGALEATGGGSPQAKSQRAIVENAVDCLDGRVCRALFVSFLRSKPGFEAGSSAREWRGDVLNRLRRRIEKTVVPLELDEIFHYPKDTVNVRRVRLYDAKKRVDEFKCNLKELSGVVSTLRDDIRKIKGEKLREPKRKIAALEEELGALKVDLKHAGVSKIMKRKDKEAKIERLKSAINQKLKKISRLKKRKKQISTFLGKSASKYWTPEEIELFTKLRAKELDMVGKSNSLKKYEDTLYKLLNTKSRTHWEDELNKELQHFDKHFRCSDEVVPCTCGKRKRVRKVDIKVSKDPSDLVTMSMKERKQKLLMATSKAGRAKRPESRPKVTRTLGALAKAAEKKANGTTIADIVATIGSDMKKEDESSVVAEVESEDTSLAPVASSSAASGPVVDTCKCGRLPKGSNKESFIKQMFEEYKERMIGEALAKAEDEMTKEDEAIKLILQRAEDVMGEAMWGKIVPGAFSPSSLS